MKYINIFIITLLLPLTSLMGQSVKGTVKSAGGSPIAAATVSVLNGTSATLTDRQGQFNLALVQGRFQLAISATGYATQIREITISANLPNLLEVILQPSGHQLDQVMVTAEKRQQEVQKIPAAITVLDETQISQYRLWDISNLTAISPSLFTVEHGNSASSNFFNIRGVMGFSNEQAVATYVDGVYQFDYFSAPVQFNDIQRIEILRGPQGTLYGRNAFGGVVNITTKQPGNKAKGYVETTLGNFGQQRYTGGLSGPIISGKLFAGGAFTYNHRGAIYRNENTQSGFDRRNDYSGNFNLRYLPSAKWSLALNGKLENNDNEGSFPWVGSAEEALSKPFVVNTNNTNIERRNNFNTSLSANYYGSDINFTSVSSYINWHAYYEGKGVDYDFTPLDILSTAPDQRQNVYTQEFRFSSPASKDSRLHWVAGAYGFLQDTKMESPTFFGPDFNAPDPALTTTNLSAGTNKGFAFFGQATYSITDKLDFTAGVRFDREIRRLSQSSTTKVDGSPTVQSTPVKIYTAGFNAFTPKFVLGYSLGDEMLIYGSYARGFRAGGLNTNAIDPEQVPYSPEHSDNFEMGWKNMFFENRLKLNLTAFYLEQHNQQISTAMDGVNALIMNVGELNNKGVELELTALPFKGLQLDWNASYSNARYNSLLLYSENAGAVLNFKGNRPINTPPLSSMLAAQYTHEFLKGRQQLSAFARAEYRHLGEYYFDFINGPSQPAYDLLNFKVGIGNKNFELNGWMRNAGNSRYIAYGSFNSFMLGTPRTYGTTLIAKF